jgi:hypothetical protein
VTSYPLVVRNNVALYLRGFMLAFLTGVALITYIALRDGPPEPHKWWPLAMVAFWACGLFGLVHSLNQETAVIRISNPGGVHVRRGKAFRTEQHRVARARFWIEDTRDGEGDPYFKLMMDAPGGKLAVKEGHSRPRLEALQQRVEAAVSGR